MPPPSRWTNRNTALPTKRSTPPNPVPRHPQPRRHVSPDCHSTSTGIHPRSHPTPHLLDPTTTTSTEDSQPHVPTPLHRDGPGSGQARRTVHPCPHTLGLRNSNPPTHPPQHAPQNQVPHDGVHYRHLLITRVYPGRTRERRNYEMAMSHHFRRHLYIMPMQDI